MHVVESQSDGIVADRIDGKNGHITFAADRLALGFGMPLHFGGRAGHPEQFGRKIEGAAVVKGNAQRAAILRQANFDRPRQRDVRHAHRRRQLGPIKLWPGSPTLAPVVVNATELGSWMVLSTIATPTAATTANARAATKDFISLPHVEPDYSAGTACG